MMSMRLLRTDTVQLVQPRANEIPQYAILSHTWGDDEVLFEHFQNETFASKAAYHTKILGACAQAKKDSWEFIWIDTCMIDKSSSAELSEAINSMYRWYHNARVCYVYLSDVPSTDSLQAMPRSRWFQRGWTLQELIAPPEVIFFAQDWTLIGTRLSLATHISEATGIDVEILRGENSPLSVSIAKRMYWASQRETTRPEDQAYCLMGLFSVAMPMLYGEGGEKAFLRLQEEIMKMSDDQSLFAWVDKDAKPNNYHGLLAASPSCFASSKLYMPYADWPGREPYAMTNMGIQLHTAVRASHFAHMRSLRISIVLIACPVPPHYPNSQYTAIYVGKLDNNTDQYVRVRASELTSITLDQDASHQRIYVRQANSGNLGIKMYPEHTATLCNFPFKGDFYVSEIKLRRVIRSSEQTGEIQRPDRPTFKVLPVPKLLLMKINSKKFPQGVLVLLIGTIHGCDLGFDAFWDDDLRSRDIASWGDYAERFNPKEPGTLLRLNPGTITANFSNTIKGFAKHNEIRLNYFEDPTDSHRRTKMTSDVISDSKKSKWQ